MHKVHQHSPTSIQVHFLIYILYICLTFPKNRLLSVDPYLNLDSQHRAPLLWEPGAGGQKCWHSHEWVFRRRPIREAWKSSGCFLDAAGYSQGVSAQRRGHRQVGELGVKVPEVCWASLQNKGGLNEMFPLLQYNLDIHHLIEQLLFISMKNHNNWLIDLYYGKLKIFSQWNESSR